MKLKNTFLGILTLLIACLFFFSTTLPDFHKNSSHLKSSSASNDETEDLQRPSDEMLFRRMYPDKAFDATGYTRILSEISSGLQRGYKTLPVGFGDSWKLEGPTNIGGRINTIAVDPGNPSIIYTGTANAGIYKSQDSGSSWKAVFEDKMYLGISHIVISPKSHNTIYAATGDPNISQLPVLGDGIYRSINAGKTWINIGPGNVGVVSKIALHPDSQQVILAASMGNPIIRDRNRGLYRTRDGGKTWTQILYLDSQTGITDVLYDWKNPLTIYAVGWTRIRTYKETITQSRMNRIYKSVNSGLSWDTLTNGLPAGINSRIGIAMSASNSSKLYTIITGSDEDLRGIYITRNKGVKWDSVGLSGLSFPVQGNFGWYFGKIYIRPSNDDSIYFGGVDHYEGAASTGKWNMISPPWYTGEVHADKHDMQFQTSNVFLLATDGGLFRYHYSSGLWQDADEIPNTQFYRLAQNPDLPKDYYGGAQDNGTSHGNGSNLNSWTEEFGGDGFQAAFNNKSSTTYAFYEVQNGKIYATDGSSYPVCFDAAKVNDRTNWDQPYFLSPFDQDVMYTGTYRVYRNESGFGCDWKAISGDLTEGNIYGDRFHNISAIAPSQKSDSVILAGTFDGNVWITKDRGVSWDSITHKLPKRYVTSLAASFVNPRTIYVTHSGFRYNDPFPHIHRSIDLGKTWTDISGDLPNVPINKVLCMPGTDSILFAGTDAGVYATQNGGREWFRLGNNMPVYPVMDLLLDKKQNRLIAATFAQGIMSYGLDSLVKYTRVIEYGSYEDSKIAFRFFPNPVTDGLANVSLNIHNDPGNSGASLSILDLSGRVMSEYAIKTSTKNMTLNLSRLSSGTYIVRLKCGEAIES